MKTQSSCKVVTAKAKPLVPKDIQTAKAAAPEVELPKVAPPEAEPDTMEALNMKLIAMAKETNLGEVQKLLANGASAKFVDDPPGVWGSQNVMTALHMALSNARSKTDDSKEIVMALIAAGADPNQKRSQYDWRGCGHSESAFDMLLQSALASDPAVLEAFLAAGADPNKRQVISRHSMRTDGETISVPLHTAVRRADANVVGVLLRAGADPNIACTERYSNERGFNQQSSRSPLHLAIDSKKLDLVLLLLAEGADPNAIASRLDQVDSGERGTTDDPRAEAFVSSVRCVPVRETALHRALQAKQPEMVRALLATGADQTVPRSWDNTDESTSDLAARVDGAHDGELTEALRSSAGWTPENHKYYSEKMREQVRTVLLVAKASSWTLPDDALFQIFAALAKAPKAPDAAGNE